MSVTIPKSFKLDLAVIAAAVISAVPVNSSLAKPDQVATLEFATLSAFSSEPIETLFLGNPIGVDAGTQNLKLSLIFSAPLAISRVRVESCAEEFGDGAEFFYYPSYLRSFSEGGKAELVTEWPVKVRDPESLTDSLTVHFKLNENVCLRSLKIFDRSGKVIALKTAQAAKAKWVGPNAPSEIFDSRRETAYEVEPKEIKIAFQEERKISGLKIWNGDQFSPALFSEHKKLSGLLISTDTMPPKEFKLTSEVGAQIIRFTEVVSTRHLILKPLEKSYVSEIRMIEPTGDAYPWFEIPLQITARPQASIVEKDSGSIFNRELASVDDSEPWIFRFRSDGSVFVSGRVDQEKTAGKFVVNGRYKIIEKDEKRLKVEVFGVRRALAVPWDGQDCGVQCSVNSRKSEVRVTDTLIVEMKKGNWIIRNRTPARKKGLPFTDLKVKISSLVE